VDFFAVVFKGTSECDVYDRLHVLTVLTTTENIILWKALSFLDNHLTILKNSFFLDKIKVWNKIKNANAAILFKVAVFKGDDKHN
jgi:hypothetical protein